MKHTQAVKIAVAAIEREIKSLAVDANMHDLFKADYPYAIRASKRRVELLAAIKTLKEPQQAIFYSRR